MGDNVRYALVQTIGRLVALAAILIATAFGLGFVTGRAYGDDSAEYWRARVQAAISLATTKGGTDVAPAVASNPKTAKPVVYLYVTADCAPCRQAKADLKHADLPFRIVIATPNIPVDSFPTFHWNDHRGKGRIWSGWNGVKHLEATWRATQGQADSVGSGAARTTFRSSHRWSYPGEIRSHLTSTHGLSQSEASLLTREQAEQIHDALHEGHSVQQIRAYARQHGYIK